MILVEKWEFVYIDAQKELNVLEYRTGTPYQYEVKHFLLHPNDMPIWVREGVALLDLAIMGDYMAELPGVGVKRFAHYQLIYKGTRWERVKLRCMRFLRGWRGGPLGVILAIVLSIIGSFHALALCAFFSGLYENAYATGFGLLWMILTAIIMYFTGKFFIEHPKEKE